MASHVGKDPLTWSHVKLFARQITRELGEFEGIPGSHAWKWRHGDGVLHTRLFTKAQAVGVLVSVQERSERVEFLVDDGTALVKAVLWSSLPWNKSVVLGDLVHVEGKLNMDKNWNDGVAPDREIRISHMSKVDDSNEELLHWVDTMELSRTVYSTNPTTCTSISTSAVIDGGQRSTSHSSPQPTISNGNHPSRGKSRQGSSSSTWDQIAVDAFFQLTIDLEAKARFLSREGSQHHDELLVETLEELLNKQSHLQGVGRTTSEKSSGDDDSDLNAVRVTFIDTLESIAQRHPERPLSDATRPKVIRHLRKTYAVLRTSGLLFLEDEDSDRHVLLTFEFALKPALLQLLRGNESGMTEVELTEWLVTQSKFQRLPLEWLEISLERLLQTKLIMKREGPEQFYLATST